jgi:hypothetical protein
MSRPPNANGRSLGGRKQTQSSPQSDMSCAFAQAKPEHLAVEGRAPWEGGDSAARPFATYATVVLAKMLSACPPSSTQRTEIQRELRIRLNEAIRQIEQEFSLPPERTRRNKWRFPRATTKPHQN